MKMTRLLLFITLIVFGGVNGIAWAQNYPTAPQGYVSDFAGVIDAGDKEYIARLAKELEDKTTDQLAVVTINSTQPETIEGYAVELFKRWGIGQKGKDNGILLLVSLQDRTVRIETGYGLEGTVTDLISDKVIRNMIVPSFKSGQYSTGIKEGVTAIVSVIANANGIKITGEESRIVQSLQSDNNGFSGWLILLIIIASFFLRGFFWPLILMGGYGGGHGHGRGGGFSGGGGGFGGGFGGGMSGGGGASGRW